MGHPMYGLDFYVWATRPGVPPIRLSMLTNPAGLPADISAMQAAVGALGGCG
jgi:hypothetical protein